MPCFALLGALIIASFSAVLASPLAPTSSTNKTGSAVKEASAQLEDVTAQSGVDFVHFNGMTGRFYYLETVGAGGALFDYDNDGDLDLYLVQGALIGPDVQLSEALLPWKSDEPPLDRLYRNDLTVDESGKPSFHFTDVTKDSKIEAGGYGIGAAVGDIDNDGFADLYVLNYGRNQLWRNRGDGTFEEIAATLAINDPRFSVSGSFADFDQDGMLDLYVANYVDFSLLNNKTCLTDRGDRDYCGPNSYRGVPDRLFRNQWPGPFRDLSLALNVETPGAGMGVLAADYDGNGMVDFYVANDLDPNNLFLGSKSEGTTAGSATSAAEAEIEFTDEALLYGVAVNKEGEAEASMGLDAADFDGDGDLDLFATHFRRESNTLYVRDDAGFFVDGSFAAGLGEPSFKHTAFGTRFVDIDLDGDLDLLVANGAVTFQPGVDRTKNPYPLDEPNQIFINESGKFVDASDRAGSVFESSAVSRALLVGDLDNDGDQDFVVTNNSGKAQVVRNNAQPRAGLGWIGLDLRLGTQHGNRIALGATVTFDPPAKQGDQDSQASVLDSPLMSQPRVVRVHNDGSYAAAADHRVVRLARLSPDSTLAPGAEPASLYFSVKWPDGGKEEFRLPLASSATRYNRIIQGSGSAAGDTASAPQPKQ